MHLVRVLLLIWLSAGVVTAVAGLAWTCKKSSEMFNETLPSSSASD